LEREIAMIDGRGFGFYAKWNSRDAKT